MSDKTELAVKDRTLEGFGPRLTQIRKSRGLTQIDLGAAVGVSNRVIAYYELESTQPPGALLVDLARVLQVSTDELLGVKPPKHKPAVVAPRILKRLEKIAQLSQGDQKAILKIIDGFLEGRASRRHAA